MLGTSSGWSQAAPAGPHDGSRDGEAELLLEALSRLSPSQRRDYLQALRTLEDSRSRARLTQLDQTQRCLAQAGAVTAVRSCWQSLARAQKQQRRQQMQQQQALIQRFGLPMPRSRGWQGDEARPQPGRQQSLRLQSQPQPLQPWQSAPQLPYGWS